MGPTQQYGPWIHLIFIYIYIYIYIYVYIYIYIKLPIDRWFLWPCAY